MIISPCISICKTDPQTGYCYGCGRSNEEKKLWKLENTSNQWKNDNLTDIQKGRFRMRQRVLRIHTNIKQKMVFLFLKKI